MKILHYLGMSSKKYGGVERFLVNLIKEAVKHDIQIYLVYYDTPWSDAYVADVKSVGGEIICLNPTSLFSIVRQYKAIMRRIKPDAVHFHFGNEIKYLALMTKFSPKYKNVKLFYTLHCCMYAYGKHILSYSELGLRSKAGLLFGNIFKLYDMILPVSEFVCKQYLSVFPVIKRIKTVYLGCNAPHISSQANIHEVKNKLGITDEFILCSVMFASPIKGADILVKAISLLKCRFKLILIGLDDSPYTKQIVDLSKELGVYDKIVWIGISNEVSKYMEISDIYIQPSRMEALSLACVEAASYSKPIIGSDVGGLPEISSIVCLSENPIELAKSIEQIHSDRVLYTKLATKSFEKWDKIFRAEFGIQKYIELYETFHNNN